MPVIICEKDGRQFATLICPHVFEQYDRKSDPNGIVGVRGTWIDQSTEMLLFWCCTDCTDSYSFGSEAQPIDYVNVADEFEKSLVPVCNICFEAWLKGLGQK